MAKSLLSRLQDFLSKKTIQGTVERVEPLTDQELQETISGKPRYAQDSFGNYPKKVFYRNRFGDLISEETPIVPVSEDRRDFRRKYQEYKPGDKFP